MCTPFIGLLDEMESTNDTGVLGYLIEHTYEEHGEYNVTCRQAWCKRVNQKYDTKDVEQSFSALARN